MLSHSDYRRFDSMIDMLRPLDSVTKASQDDTTAMSEVRAVFNAVIDEFLETANRLNSSADVVLYKEFENAIVKFQRYNVSGLPQDEALAISKLIVHIQRESNMNDRLSFAL